MTIIQECDIVDSIAEALQFISYYHPPDFIRHMKSALEREESSSARDAITQILVNSRMAAIGRRPICQDTGTVNVFIKLGMKVSIASDRTLQEMVDVAIRRAYLNDDNPLRASIVLDPISKRTNSGDNTPGMVHVDLVSGDKMEIAVSAKGGGSENKARFTVLEPSDSVSDWVVKNVASLGAGWCPPGILGIGIGGSADKAMLMAKEAMNEEMDMLELAKRGPSNRLEELRLEIFERVNALGIGAQGLGGKITLLDVKIKTFPTHAASLPLAVIPNCAATRHMHFELDGTGPAHFTPPDLSDWPELVLDRTASQYKHVNLDQLTETEIAAWHCGDTLLLSGTLYTGRDAAHKRMVEALRAGDPVPVDLKGKAIYYVGPVDAVGSEIIGPAGPTTATRMDRFTDEVLGGTGLKVMIGKAERGKEAIEAIARHKAAYLIAVGGAAYLVSKAVKSAKRVAYNDLGMEAIYELRVEEMPVTVAVDCRGESIHTLGPAKWRKLDA
ncbi:fumarate hydratase [Rhizobium pusense]|jgi:fumarate hydratase class I|uniref:fumarate hydratase n=1 Tax=Agrobacterium pusense TaxID=648995 RepID=UPI0010AE907B|nr:fumarate hydratase [Agrobacterium pusense]MDH0117128.1 fumarate hydratase [Agrobacterium pusense]